MQDKHKVNHIRAHHNKAVEKRCLKRMSEKQPEKKDITYKGTQIRMIANFSSRAIQDKNLIK